MLFQEVRSTDNIIAVMNALTNYSKARAEALAFEFLMFGYNLLLIIINTEIVNRRI